MMIPTAVATLLFALPIPLPSGPPVVMDYLAYDAEGDRVWIPAGNTGNVDVLDVATGKLTAVEGFATAANTRPGRPKMGPSSATVGAESVFVGNRADSAIWSVNRKTLQKAALPIAKLSSSPDGLALVEMGAGAGGRHELWTTTPRTQSISVEGCGRDVVHETIKLEGEPEGYAVDAKRGVFYTNLEDKDRTLAIDVKTRKVVSTWSPGCGKEGPRGLALDDARRFLFVACTDGVVTLDLAHEGKAIGRLATGGGVDNIDYAPATSLLYVASGKDATLTIAKVAASGALTVAATAATAPGARVVVVDKHGTAYVADSQGGRILVVKVPPL